MRAAPVLWLAILLCRERVRSLLCYTCPGAPSASLCPPAQCLRPGICFDSNITTTSSSGMQVRSKYKGCAPSCEEAKETLQWIFLMSSLDQLDQLDPSLPKSELQSLTCCEKDLCNRGAQALGPGGGLLLGLAPASLWALL
ncbi:unnamed protein product [Nyctereutes procyonoides]|uniref:(raccoon dog) hypothetical protein n=2 Tax=Nyctereutes procyonoides TaxID=34880 RepID=A0A811ZYM5_NYCPR|nr:unnamed protein product [Nyctereutes procyonoides]